MKKPSLPLDQEHDDLSQNMATVTQSAGWQGAPSPTPEKKGEA